MKTKSLLGLIFSLLLIASSVKSQGQLWGLTMAGGTMNQGAIIHGNIDGTGLTVAHSFADPAGYHPYGDLMLASDGNLYGTCFDGGSYESCTIFRFSPSTGIYTDVYDFDIVNGDFPTSGLVEGPNSKLYGVGSSGGVYFDGVIYSYDMNTELYTMLHSFDGSNGSAPNGSPVLLGNGKLYGMTSGGGSASSGVLYSYDIATYTYSVLYNFTYADGYYPLGNLIELPDGKLYGLTTYGGINNSGVLFSFDPDGNTFTKLFEFGGLNGSAPKGSLMLGTDGLLYGLTSEGGVSGAGVIFSYNLNTFTFTKLFDFFQADGATPLGKLYQSGNILCGTTYAGGSFNQGVMFNYDISNSTYTKVIEFDGTNGSAPTGGFISVNITGIASNNFNHNLSVYPNPVRDELNIALTAAQQESATINLRDINGNIAYAFVQDISGTKPTTINVKGVDKGTYFLEIKTTEGTLVKKVVKQ